MAKAKRGKNIKKTINWRGTCLLCNRTGVKLLWESANAEGTKIKACKRCASK